MLLILVYRIKICLCHFIFCFRLIIIITLFGNSFVIPVYPIFSSIKVYLLYYSVYIFYGVNHESFMLFLVFVGMLFYNYFCSILFFISSSNLPCFFISFSYS